MRLPDFFLVGAPKAGTTSVYNYLSQHPEIFTPAVKEPHFFSCPEVKDTYYEVPFVDEIDEYKSLFREASQTQKAGDFSTSYLHHKKAAHRIKRMCPNARILIILRDPVERAISHYLMDVRDGYQRLPLIECLKEKNNVDNRFYREYVDVGMYSSQIERYRDIFGGKKVKIFLFDNLVSRTEETLGKLMRHIRVDERVDISTKENHNEYQRFKYGFVKSILKSKVFQVFSKRIPVGVKNKAKSVFVSKDKPDLTRARSELQKVFRDDVVRLQNVIDKDLSGWLR